jgi:hypothetical protein
MISHTQYSLIHDLVQKISLYHNDNSVSEKTYSFNSLEAQNASHLLNVSSLNFTFDRDTVISYLQGERKVKLLSTEEEVSIQSSVTIERLEELLLIRFIDGKAKVQSIRKSLDEFDDEEREIAEAINNLSSIACGQNDFERSELRVSEAKIREIILTLEPSEYIEKRGNEYSFKFGHDDICPVGSELWKLLSNQDESKDAFNKWLFFMQNAFDYSNLFTLNFENENSKNIFLNEAVEYILCSESLRDSWENTYKKLILEYNRYDRLLYNNIDFTLPEFLSNINPEKSLLNAYLWWNNRQTSNLLFMNGFNFYISLVYFISKNDHFLLDQQASYLRTKKLILECLTRPILAGQLLKHELNTSLIPLYLSQHDTLVIGMMHITSNNNVPNLLTDSMDYLRQWKEIIWTQALDIFFLNFEKCFDVKSAGETIADLLILLVKEHFERHNRHLPYLTKTLTFFETVYCIRSTGNPKESLISCTLPILIEKVITGDYGRNFSFRLPYEKIYLLMWLLDKTHRESLRVQTQNDASSLAHQIISEVINLYSTTLQTALENNGLQESETLDSFDWNLLLKLSTVEQKKTFLNAIEKTIVNEDMAEDNVYACLHVIRVHFRLLLSLYRSASIDDLENIEKALLDIVQTFGESKNWKKDIFQPFLEKNENAIWGSFVQISNQFSEASYESFLTYALTNASVANLFELYKNTASMIKKKRILKLLKARQIDEEDFTSIPEIINTLILALNEELNEFSEPLLSIFEQNQRGDYYAKTFQEIRYKASILKIFHQKMLKRDERVLQIYKIVNPFSDRKNFGNPNQSMEAEMDRYKRLLIGLLYFEDEPKKTYNCMTALLSESAQPIYALNMLNARYKDIENTFQKDDANYLQAYLDALNEWDRWSQSFSNHKADVFEYLLRLEGYKTINDYEKFSKCWNAMPEHMKKHLSVAPIRCQFLQKHHMSLKALEYLDEVLHFHGDIEEPKKSEFEKIQKELSENLEIEHKRETTPFVVSDSTSLSIEDAKNYWLKIKNMMDEHHAKIFSRTDYSLQEFILENMRLLSLELLERRKNIKRKNDDGLELEDIINDWVTSLLKQRMNFLSWKINDQSRGGVSSSQQNPGERDIVVCNQGNEQLFIVEAFKLFASDQTTIKTHMDKLDGYNATGCQTLIILVYCDVNDFTNLYTNYIAYLSQLQYNGFESSILPSLKFSDIDSNSINLKIFHEIREKNSKDITLYHLLCDFH